jgi:RecB family exonuclease
VTACGQDDYRGQTTKLDKAKLSRTRRHNARFGPGKSQEIGSVKGATADVTLAERSTRIVHGRLANRDARLMAARERRHGLQIMSFEQAAARLAGGFARPIDEDSLRVAIQAALRETPMGELEGIKALPGMIDAAADTLRKVWRAGIDLKSRAASHPRLVAIASLEAAVLDRLPPGMMRPVDIVSAATARMVHSAAVLGNLEIVGLTELSPCWRPLLMALAAHIPVTWIAGPRRTPGWLDGSGIAVSRTPPESPDITVVSAATAYHEAIEAMRWVRALLASGKATPAEFAIATASPSDYDDHFLALREHSNIGLHFVHGVRTVTTREGQATAALADIVVRGLSHSRLRRLLSLCRGAGPFASLPEGWVRVLPTDSPMSTSSAWSRLLAQLGPEDWPDGADHTPALRNAVDLLSKGPGSAVAIGEAFLEKRALAIWQKALLAGPAASIDATIECLKQDDGLEPSVSVAWMPASALAAAPRRFVRLIGLNSSRWPRGISEDRLIPDHIVPTAELDPLPIGLADRRDFETILATTGDEVVLSRARRDSEGRLLGRSPMLAAYCAEVYVRRNAVPMHAFSETDRLMARPKEFAATPQAASARACWRDWRRAGITPHDGLIRAGHPLVLAILARTQSASSLQRLLRNPIGFVWKYALGWRAADSGSEPLVLDALGMGELIHAILDRALCQIDASGGLAKASAAAVEAAVAQAAKTVAVEWENERTLPPEMIWQRTLDDARLLSVRALTFDDTHLPGTRSFTEVPFGGSEPKSEAKTPWDPSLPVTIPGAGFCIAGYIDRLDIAGDGRRALVRDYKTGRAPRDDIRLNGGRELQRCLYAFAAKALLGRNIKIDASLLYLRESRNLELEDPEGALTEVAGHLRAARKSLASGSALPGPDTGGGYDDLLFALPANAGGTYCTRKRPAAIDRLGDAALVWEAE